MKIRLICILIFMMSLTLVLSGKIHGQNNISVVGIVVDDEGKPISKAMASLHSSCKGCVDHNIPVFTTNEEGVFYLRDFRKLDKVRILIEGPIPDRLWNLTGPAHLTLKRFPEFRGVIVKRPESGATIQLGEIKPHIQYEAVSVDLLQLFNRNKEFLKGNSSLKISVEFKDVRIEDKARVEERDFDRAENKVRLALPKGRWKLIFKLKNGSKQKVGTVLVDLETDKTPIYNYQADQP